MIFQAWEKIAGFLLNSHVWVLHVGERVSFGVSLPPPYIFCPFSSTCSFHPSYFSYCLPA